MKKTRKMVALLAAAAMTVGLTACGGAEKPAETTAAPATTAAETTAAATEAATEAPAAGGMELTTAGQNYLLATMGVDTTAYSRSAAIVEVLSKGHIGTNTIELSPTATGGAAGIMLVEAGQTQLAQGSNVPGKKLVEGTYEEGRAPVTNVAALAGGLDVTWGTIMFTDAFVQKTGFKTLEEVFEAKYPVRIVTKAPGTFGMDGATDMLECFGLTWEDIESWGGAHYHIGASQMTDMLKEGSADISMDIVSIGQPAFTELCMTSTMHVIQLGEETRKKMAEKGYAEMTMPADSWKGQTEPIETITGCETLVASKDVPDDVAYAITKGLCENIDDVAALVPSMAKFDPKQAWTESMCGIELHPGAAAYYKDAGLMK